MRFFQQQKRGMSLVQTLVILGIIAILSTVILASISDAKKKARDKERVSDLQGIQLALRMYKDLNGTYPDHDDSAFPGGVVIGVGKDIDTALAPYFPSIPKDGMQVLRFKHGGINVAYAGALPNEMHGSDVVYGYVYDSNFDCPIAGSGKKVIYAKSTELSASSNWATVCGGSLPGTGGPNPGKNSYIIILK